MTLQTVRVLASAWIVVLVSHDAHSQAPPRLAGLVDGFIANRGQFPEPVTFAAHDGPATLLMTLDGLTVQLVDRGSLPRHDSSSLKSGHLGPAALHRTGTNIRLRFEGCSLLRAESVEPPVATLNYLNRGPAGSSITGVPIYRSLQCGQVLPGLDLSATAQGGSATFRFQPTPGFRGNLLVLSLAGADVGVNPDDSRLQLRTPAGTVTVALTLQPDGDLPAEEIPPTIIGDGTVSYDFSAAAAGSFPVFLRLSYSTYLGGSEIDEGFGVDAVPSGAATYYCGFTSSSTIAPTFPGPFDQTANGLFDGFVAKVNATGTQLVYASFIGGTADDHATDIAVDADGNAYVIGLTASSTSFPTTSGAWQTLYGGGAADAFALKLDPTGSTLLYSTLLGGSKLDWGFGVDVDSAGAAYVTGMTSSTDYFTSPGAFNSVLNQGNPADPEDTDIFVTKIAPDGGSLSYSTFISGTRSESGFDIAVDDSGGAHIAGVTGSADIPTTPNPLSGMPGGGDDGYTASLNATGTQLVHATYFNGVGHDSANAIAVNAAGTNLWLGGHVSSDVFQDTQGAYDVSHNGGLDGYVAKVILSPSSVSYCTFLGGSGDDIVWGLDVDASGNAFVVGTTESADFPITSSAYDSTFAVAEAFIAKINATGSTLVSSTFLGGSAGESGNAIVRRNSSVWVTGGTDSADFPLTTNPLNGTFGGATDAYLAKLSVP